ncbi:MAG: hypothetical protein M3Q93_03765 [Gemmatimonadota bacterium]|nr:hypothetical protein [Gemmatimonadota bacterium]
MSASRGTHQRHFVDVWNPSYAADSMDAHLTLLRAAAKRFERKEIVDEALHVWWGKVRSPHRQQELKQLPDVREIAAELESDHERECHLYLTDYSSLYVGHVDAISEADARTLPGAQVPGYYDALGLACDFWYRLLDIRRLATDTRAVIAELKPLLNLGYNEMPVSLYGGMVGLPLVAYRPDGRRFFDAENRDDVIDGHLWAEFDAEQAGVGAIERELRENLFGEEGWTALDPAARSFIASAEKVFRDQRADPAFDYGPVITNLAKALEVICNAVLRQVAPILPRELRQVTVDGKPLDLADGRHLSLGQLAHVLRPKGALQRALRQRLENGDWFVDRFPGALNEVVQVRNPGAHREQIGRESAIGVRDRLVGVGCQGVFTELTKVKLR